MSDSMLTLKKAKRVHRKENPGLPFKEWLRQNKTMLYENFTTFDAALEKILKKEPLGTKPSEEYKRKPKKATPEPPRDKYGRAIKVTDETLSTWLADRFSTID